MPKKVDKLCQAGMGVAKSLIYKVLQNLDGTQKTACKRTTCSESHQGEEEAACQCGNDNDRVSLIKNANK